MHLHACIRIGAPHFSTTLLEVTERLLKLKFQTSEIQNNNNLICSLRPCILKVQISYLNFPASFFAHFWTLRLREALAEGSVNNNACAAEVKHIPANQSQCIISSPCFYLPFGRVFTSFLPAFWTTKITFA